MAQSIPAFYSFPDQFEELVKMIMIEGRSPDSPLASWRAAMVNPK
jgi:hypothetical protein